MKFILLSIISCGLVWAQGIQLPIQPPGSINLPHKDVQFQCVNASVASQFIRDFNINVRSFGGRELCKNNHDTKKLLNDILLVRDGRFSGTDSNIFINGFVNSSGYYSWLKQMTRGVERGQDVPAATAYNRGGYFTMQDGWAELTTLGRVGVIIHEARHTAGYGHTRCSQGPYRDSWSSGCDSSIRAGGSHGVEMEYYSRVVLQGANFHPVYSSMARMMNLARANFVFNKSSLKKHEALAVRTKNQVVILDGTDTLYRDMGNFSGLQMKRSSQGLTFFNSSEAIAFDIYAPFNEAFEDDYTYFKIMDLTPFAIKDLVEFDIGTRRYLVAIDQNGGIYSFDFPKGKWGQKVRLTKTFESFKTRNAAGDTGLFVKYTDGSYDSFEPQRSRLASAGTWPVKIKSYADWNGQSVALDHQGTVHSKDPFPVKDDITEMVNIPLYDAFDFE